MNEEIREKEPRELPHNQDPAKKLPTRLNKIGKRIAPGCLILLIFGSCMVVRECTKGSPPHPLSLQQTVMYYDTSREKPMLYATGYKQHLESASYETPSIWSWTGDHWRLEGKAAGVPGGRALCGYDPVNPRLAVYLLEQGETWILEDDKWKRMTNKVQSQDWANPGILYNPRERQVQLHTTKAVYELTDNSWKLAHQHEWRMGSIEAGPVYDAKYDRIVAYGSEVGGRSFLSNVLWEVKGNEWKRLASEVFRHGPFGDKGKLTAIVYDEARETVILIIDPYKTEHYRMLELAGEEVRSVRSENPAPRRHSPTFCYNPKTKSIMMHGGQRSGYGITYLNETWEIRYSPEHDLYVWNQLE